jgi:hypothetical protein
MSPVGIHPFAPPPSARQPATVQDRLLPASGGAVENERSRGQDKLRRAAQKAGAPIRFKADAFEQRPTVKLPAIQQFPAKPAAAKAGQPQGPQGPAQRSAPKAASKPEPTMLIQAPAPQAAAPGGAKAPNAPAPGAMEGMRRRGAELVGRMAGSASRALDGLELTAQLKRVSNPSGLWNVAARVVGAAGDAARGAASRFSLFAQGVETAQRYAQNGAKLPLPKGGGEAPERAGSAQDWRRANEAFALSDRMVRSLAVADDDGAREAAAELLPILMDHAQRNPATGADAVGALRRVSDAAAALGQASEPADAAQAARELRSAGKQVRQLFAEQGGGAQTLSTDQAASLQRLATVVRGGDTASDAFRRGSHRSLAAIGAELATALSRGGDGQAAQAITLRDRTHELLSAQASGNGEGAVSAAKRLHVAIRQAQAGAQWERDRLLSQLAPRAA